MARTLSTPSRSSIVVPPPILDSRPWLVLNLPANDIYELVIKIEIRTNILLTGWSTIYEFRYPQSKTNFSLRYALPMSLNKITEVRVSERFVEY